MSTFNSDRPPGEIPHSYRPAPVPGKGSSLCKEFLDGFKCVCKSLRVCKAERSIYTLLSNALNLGLESLPKIEVDWLPKFQNYVLFVPLNEGVAPERDQEGSLFPTVVLVPFTTACDLYKIEGTRGLSIR